MVCDDGSVDLTGSIAEAMGATLVRHGNMDDVYIYRSTLTKDMFFDNNHY